MTYDASVNGAPEKPINGTFSAALALRTAS